MMSARTLLGLTLLAVWLVAAPACAEEPAAEPPAPCDVPGYLLSSESVLPKVRDAVKANQPLNVLVVGSRSSTIPNNEASAYPAKLQAALKEALPQAVIDLSVELQAKSTAEETAATLVKLVEAKSLLWSSGRPARSMLCEQSIPTISAAPSTTALLRCRRPGPTWCWSICNIARARKP